MNSLGLSQDQLCRHIAWDPGAAEVVSGLADCWQATALLGQYSRLVVDLNRPLGDSTSIPEVSDNTIIPGNAALGDQEIRQRSALFYFPYHAAIEIEIGRLRRLGSGLILVSIHSFTPEYGDEQRPWHVGIMSATDRRLADVILRSLSMRGDLIVGDNQPYSGVDLGYTLRLHGCAQGLANVQIEIRQDCLNSEHGIRRWTKIIDDALSPLINDPDIQRIEYD